MTFISALRSYYYYYFLSILYSIQQYLYLSYYDLVYLQNAQTYPILRDQYQRYYYMNEIKQQGKATPKPTPRPSRSYLSSQGFLHTPASHSQPPQINEDDYYNEYEGVIYGTNISVNKTMRDIQRFITTFECTFERQDGFETEKVYLAKLRDLQNVEDKTIADMNFDVDGQHLYKYSQVMYHQLIYFPVEMISCFDTVLRNLYEQQFIEPETINETLAIKAKRRDDIKIGLINLINPNKIMVKDLSPKKLGKLMAIRGLVIRVSQIYPEMKTACFICAACHSKNVVALQNAKIEEPTSCQYCHKSECLELIHNLCEFTNKQYIKFQELLQNISQGHSPASTTIISYDSNVDRVKPGDCIEMVGIYRCYPVPVNRAKLVFRQIFNTYFDMISFEMLQDKGNKIKNNKSSFSDDQIKTFFRMANEKTVMDDLIDSFAPSIFGNREIKKGILTQLLGGTKKDQIMKDRKFRSQVNICLVGDPSTAKSQFLQQVHKIAPRSIYTCGRGSSAVGLTASVKKDPQTKEFVLESGALVLSDHGICCIDQFDKMDPNTRTVLLQVMQQQTISIAKAGIVCQLNSRTAILAAANPINSKYDTKKSVVQNINLPPALLSRFDLIYIMLDIANQQQDKRLATHILNIYASDSQLNEKSYGKYSMQQLANYISFAKDRIAIIGEQAAERLKKEYIQMRNRGKSHKTIIATPRLLEAMIRLSQAFAKMRLSNEVTAQDVEGAIELINNATLKSAVDPDTGLIDMDILTTGRTFTSLKRSQQLSLRIKDMLLANETLFSCFMSVGRFQQQLRKKFPWDQPTKQDIVQALQILQSEDFIYLIGNKQSRKIKLKNFNEA